MDEQTFNAITGGLIWSIKRYPHCKIANCDCDSKNGERKNKCMCLCHIDEWSKEK